VKIDKEGKASYNFTPMRPLEENAVTATSTNELTGDSSEFSKPVTAS
jgi:hypothetical protein